MFNSSELLCALPLLGAAAAYDICRRRIPNAITVPLALTGTATAWWTGGLLSACSALAAAVLVGVVLLLAWRARAVGGGDLKLMVAAAAWVGFGQLISFALATGVVGGSIAGICLAMSNRTVQREIGANLILAAHRAMPTVSIRQENGRISVPYGAAIAGAALWVLYRS